jgi:hypothetical protein
MGSEVYRLSDILECRADAVRLKPDTTDSSRRAVDVRLQADHPL